MVALLLAVAVAAPAAPRGNYADVAGVQMYYEVHGEGWPVVLLHGGLGTIETTFSKILPELARDHRVIAVEQVGHGHTADREGPYSYAHQAENTAALLRHVGVSAADVVGYSDGGILALILALRHPDLVRRLVISGANIRPDGIEAKALTWMQTTSAVEFAKTMSGAGRREAYDRTSPDGPGHWSVVSEKVRALWVGPVPIEPADLGHVAAPALVVCGDHDTIKVEHSLEIFRALPQGQLLVLPDTKHDTFNSRPAILNAVIGAFLAAPAAEK